MGVVRVGAERAAARRQQPRPRTEPPLTSNRSNATYAIANSKTYPPSMAICGYMADISKRYLKPHLFEYLVKCIYFEIVGTLCYNELVFTGL